MCYISRKIVLAYQQEAPEKTQFSKTSAVIGFGSPTNKSAVPPPQKHNCNLVISTSNTFNNLTTGEKPMHEIKMLTRNGQMQT